MPSMIDTLLNSSGASPVSQLGSRFGLSEDRVQQAIKALAPALSIGMKRNTQSPMGAGALIHALTDGNHERYADDPGAALSDAGIAEGNKILGHVLGSKDVSRAVAAQAAQETGIGQSTLKQMLPMLASMFMGSMSKSAKYGISGGGGGGILGQIIEGMLRSGIPGQHAPQRRTSDGDNPLGRMFEDMLAGRGGQPPLRTPKRRTTDEGVLGEVFEDAHGRGTRSSRNRPVERPPANDPLGDLLDKFLDGDDRQLQPEDNGQRQRPRSGGSLTDIFGDMFDTGRKADDRYQNDLESIFDEYGRNI